MRERVVTALIYFLWLEFIFFYFTKIFTLKNIYLFVKVCIKYNQVEVALQALHGSVEKVVFGAASLRDKHKPPYLLMLLQYLIFLL